MTGVRLPGGSRVEFDEVPVPQPGPGQVLLEVHASSICGSDLRAIYREHIGEGPEGYRGVIAGHEPCGRIVALGPGVTGHEVGERVAVYHIAGCGQCAECRHGFHIGCTAPTRAAYGWQRDGGHAPYLLAEAVSCLPLPDQVSYVDGALVSCGFGTAYEGLLRLGVSGRDELLVTGLGPVGLAAAMLGRALGAIRVVGTDVSAERRTLATELGLVDVAVDPTDAAALDAASGAGFTCAIDCSGNGAARRTALERLQTWGRCAFVGMGGTFGFDAPDLLIERQLTLYGSWVTSLRHMAELLQLLPTWDLHPEIIVTHRFGLAEAADAYRAADSGATGKVCIEPLR